MIKSDLALFNDLVKALLQDEVDHAVSDPVEAATMIETMDLSLSEHPASPETFTSVLKTLVLSTPKTSSVRFFNQLFGGRKGKAILGDLLAVMLNNSMYTHKVAGPMVGVEKVVLHKIIQMIGYPESADGTFASGGSMANLMAMIMARDKTNPDVHFDGAGKSMIFYTSTESHYSIPKNAALIGIGRNNVRAVAVDDYGRMSPEDLEMQIKEDLEKGHTPCFVNATAGTTVIGAFDPIEKLHPICEKYDLWLHIDGAYCGGVIFSNSHKSLVKGLEKTDSFSFNAHKMLNTPLTCSILVTRDKKHLYDSFSNEANYLYQSDVDEFNLGKTSLQCGRRNDALKVWTLWKAIGRKGLEKMVDNQYYLADVARNYIRQNDDYTLYDHGTSPSVCFVYKNIPPDVLCQKLLENSCLIVGHGSFKGNSFIRLVTINSTNTEEEIIQFFKEIEKFVALHF